MEPTTDVSLPQPPTPLSPAEQSAWTQPFRTIELRPGHLVPGWTTTYWLGWLLIGGAYGAVWYSSRVTGLGTWWLGPRTEPRYALHILPFVAPFTLSFLALRMTRHMPWLGLVGAAVGAGIAAGDLAVQPRYAVIEFALAAAGLAISVASFAGLLREAPEPDKSTTD